MACGPSDGITLSIENVGTAPLDSLLVLTTGHEYTVGTVEPGASRTLHVEATSESHIELEYGIGERRRLIVGTYFEPGYRGRIRIKVTQDSIVELMDSVRVGPY